LQLLAAVLIPFESQEQEIIDRDAAAKAKIAAEEVKEEKMEELTAVAPDQHPSDAPEPMQT